ncbi:hypothetical protein ACQPVP_09380 [Clostridium nigeriense]|uniref:hypothetical protein n=1 Tax=Clostridium nigeriense TaxID=1805470 RepID=UPI003D3478C3
MINKEKKKGFAFIESLVVLMFVTLLIAISLNLITLNYLKSQTYKSYSDKKTLTLEDELVLKEINKNNKEEYKDSNYQLVKKEKEYFLVKKLSNSNIYIELEMKEYNDKKIFVPTYYKTENIVGDKL